MRIMVLRGKMHARSIHMKIILQIYMETFQFNTLKHFLGISIYSVYFHTFTWTQILRFSLSLYFHVFIHIILMIFIFKNS